MLINDFPGRYLYNVSKLEIKDINQKKHIASGFWFSFRVNNHAIAALVTAKHAMDGYSNLEILTCACSRNGLPLDQYPLKLSFSSEQLDDLLIKHPTEDICCIVFQIDAKFTINMSHIPFIFCLNEQTIFDIDGSNDYRLLQEIVMIGCPNNVYDDFNNKAIAKKGVTASPMKIDYKGERKYIVNISSEHGSSGSPVFIYNKGAYFDENAFLPGNRMELAGVFLGGFEEFNKNPNSYKSIVDGKASTIQLLIPNGLGYVLKPRVILELQKEIVARFSDVLI